MSSSAILAAFGSAICWGVPPIFMRKFAPQYSSGFLMFVQACVYVVLTAAYAFLFDRAKTASSWKKVTPKVIMTLILVATIGIYVSNLLYLFAIKKTKNINTVVIISALYPVVTMILAALFLKEYLNTMGLLGSVLIFIGLAILIGSSNPKGIK